MRRFRVALIGCVVLLASARDVAFAWHDTGHMLVAQIAYQRLSPTAKARVDALLIPPPDRRPWIHLCAGGYRAETCEKTYDPITIAVWMDDFRGDSLNESYAPWHYINFRPLFDGIPEASNVVAEPENVLARINWAVNTLARSNNNGRREAETLGFLYHLVGDVHQPLHATTRYTAALPEGDAGGNGFRILGADGRTGNLHSFWDGAAGAFGSDPYPRRPLDQAGRDRLLVLANALVKEHPADALDWKDLDPHTWVVESNGLARQFAYGGIKEGEAPSPAYTEQAQKLARKRIATAGYRLAAVLNAIFVK
jgi:hypothetical protein